MASPGLGWLPPAVPALRPLIGTAEPLFALINVSAKCLMCEISFLLAGIGGAVWDLRSLRFQGQGSPGNPRWSRSVSGLWRAGGSCSAHRHPRPPRTHQWDKPGCHPWVHPPLRSCQNQDKSKGGRTLRQSGVGAAASRVGAPLISCLQG